MGFFMKKISRIDFLKMSSLAFLAFQTGCVSSASKRSVDSFVFQFLLPIDGGFPTYTDIDTEKYIAFLKHQNVLETYQLERLSDGKSLVEKRANVLFENSIENLTEQERTVLLEDVLEYRVGAKYIGFLQKLMLEAMLADSFYGFSDPRIKNWLELPIMFPTADEQVNYSNFLSD